VRMGKVDGLIDLTENYERSLELVRTLSSILVSYPSLPIPIPTSTSTPTPSPTTNPTTAPNRETDTKKEEEKERKSTPEEIQAALSLLAVQPLLPGKGSEGGSEAWEELMAVEVGGWT